MVEVTVNGAMELVKVRIDPQAVDPRDVEMLQDLVLAAVNQAVITNNSAKRWEAGMSIMERAARYDLDVALAGARPLARSIKDAQGARLSAEFVGRLFPRIQRALED